jgi:nicotinamidase-related amidase
MSNAPFDPARTAVISMDYQTAVVGMVAGAGELLPRASAVLAAARAAGLAVLHVAVGFRPGFPEVSARNQGFAAVKAGNFDLGRPEPHPAVAAGPGEAVVVKHRVGAFAGTDLEMLLRARDIDTLVLFGLTTSGVVLSTVRHASDSDYRLFVIGDLCADRDLAVHRCLLEQVFPRQAQVITAQDFIAALA